MVRIVIASIAIGLVGCGDQGPSDYQGRLVGVWRVVLDSTMAPPYSRDNHCAIFRPGRSYSYEIRNFHPEGRPTDSLGRLNRFTGSFQHRSDSVELLTTRWVRYSWLQHRTTPLTVDTVVSETGSLPVTVSESTLTLQGQPSPFVLRSRDPSRTDLCGPPP